MGKYIPGNPNTLVQNMPGAGSIVASNYLYGVAKPDGLTIGMFQTHLYLMQLVGQPEIKFDVRKFNWVGSQEKGQMMLYIRADSPYKSIDDIIKAKEPPKCGGSGTADQTALLTRLLEETVGAKFIRVLGYKGGSVVDLAMERGEVICRATRITVHFSREPFLSWDKKGFDRHLVQAGKKRDSRLPDVPTVYELMDKYKSRALKDSDLIAEVQKSRLDMEPSTGEQIQVIFNGLMTQPREVIERVKKLEEN